jgi:hypothetical protein
MVGQDEQPLSPVRRAQVGRSEQIPLRIEPERGKVAKDSGEPKPKVARDVLEEYEAGPALVDDPGDVGPQVSLVVGTELLASDAERLAGVARRDEIHAPAPASAIEGGKVVPDRSPIQDLVRHPRHESGRCVAVPLDVTHSSIGGSDGESQSDLKPASPGT